MEEGNGTAPGAGRRWVTSARSTAVCVMRPGSREDAAEGVLPGDCGKDRALNSGHRAVAGCVPGAARSGVEGEIGRFRGRHMTPVPRAASLAELNQMLADADEVDEHRRIAARIETVGQAAAREVPLLNPLPGNAFQAAAALSCRVDAKGDDLCPAVVLFGAGPARRPPGCKVALGADWIDVRHDGGSGRPAHPITAQGQREPGVGPPTWRSSCTPAGCVGRCHRPGQCPGRPACSPMGTNGSGTPHAARPGPRRHQGADRGAAAAPHPAHRGGARRDRRSGGVVLPLVRDRVIRAGVGDPGASFVTPSPISCHRTCPQGSLPEPICGRTPPG